MNRILRRPEVLAATGLSRSRLDQLERANQFPKRVLISARAVGWMQDEVEQWIADRPRNAEADNASRLRETTTEDRKRGAQVRAERSKSRDE